MFVAVGVLVIQLFSLSHLVLFAHARCEHGEMIHAARNGWALDVRLPAETSDAASIAQSEGGGVEHDHCDSFATPPAMASLTPDVGRGLLLELAASFSISASEGVPAVPILALAPKTSPTA